VNRPSRLIDARCRKFCLTVRRFLVHERGKKTGRAPSEWTRPCSHNERKTSKPAACPSKQTVPYGNSYRCSTGSLPSKRASSRLLSWAADGLTSRFQSESFGDLFPPFDDSNPLDLPFRYRTCPVSSGLEGDESNDFWEAVHWLMIPRASVVESKFLPRRHQGTKKTSGRDS
jgi:hypothetical protein